MPACLPRQLLLLLLLGTRWNWLPPQYKYVPSVDLSPTMRTQGHKSCEIHAPTSVHSTKEKGYGCGWTFRCLVVCITPPFGYYTVLITMCEYIGR
ncbi:uncharacterized protein LY79DRAFT_184145 [Colletotrichum navitas]|uniref:Secreted protein n=1 Tax=Colletotrichum navitas TaxID=681940 RepID=A0AAD8Q0X8_9PEZI|nr:uncharacterized protein LY79DRAFT_184145 [Colletotrichum navitas]KAK1593322.1 hypothetical protein LY79DRAFT_184145 [Colletotrichum navitas]